MSKISWLCGPEEAVPGMEAVGEDKTDIGMGVIPATCSAF